MVFIKRRSAQHTAGRGHQVYGAWEWYAGQSCRHGDALKWWSRLDSTIAKSVEEHEATAIILLDESGEYEYQTSNSAAK